MTALAEGVSFLTLLFVAMPMKYFMGMPEVVRVVGSIHGGLFLLYVGLLAIVHIKQRWTLTFTLYAFIASVIPFGTFMLDKHLRDKEAVVGQSGKSLHFRKGRTQLLTERRTHNEQQDTV